MSVSIETVSSLERRMTVQIPSEEVHNSLSERIQKVSKQASIKGFRPGKVPAKVIEKMYGLGIRQEVLSELIDKHLKQAIQQEKLQPISISIAEIKDEAGQPVEFVANFEEFPKVQLTDMSAIELEKLVPEVSDADVDKTLQYIREQNPTWEKVERAAQHGDQVIIDFSGFHDEQPIERGEAKDFKLILGKSAMIPGFEDPILNASAGDEVEAKLNFPEQYHAKDLAGKAAIFKIKVHEVQTSKLPELDEELMKKLGVAGLEELRKEVRENMRRDLQGRINALNKQKVMEKLLELNQVEVPKTLLEQEIKALQKSHKHDHDHTDHDHDHDHDHEHDHEHAEVDEKERELAARRVKLGLLMREIINQHNLQADPARVRQLIEELAQSYNDPEKMVRALYQNEEQLAQIRFRVLEDQAVEETLKSFKVNEKQTGFYELMEQNKEINEGE